LNYSFTPVTFPLPGTEISVITDNSLNVSSTSSVSLRGQTMAGSQTITFPQPAPSGSFVAGTVIPLNATSSAGTTIHYAVEFTGGVRPTLGASNGTETLTLGGSGTGTITVTANADATSTYNQANPVSVSFQATLVTAPASGAVLTDTAIGSSTSAEVTLQFVTAGTLGSVTGLTQGAPNLDYSATLGANDCVVGNSYVAGQVCTAMATFAPTFAGTRYGAVEVLDGSGNVLGTTLLQANGLGPQVALQPVQSILISAASTGAPTPSLVAVDAAGNVYIADYSSYGNVVKETPSNGIYTQSTVISHTSEPYGALLPAGIAIDGAGNVYVADNHTGNIYKETLSNGNYTQSNVVTADGVFSTIAVDGSGNIYVCEPYKSLVLKETLSNGTYSQSTIDSTVQFPVAITVDGMGNVYVAENINTGDYAVLFKETPSNGAYIQSTIDSQAIDPYGMAVDGIGNVYYADSDLPDGSAQIIKETLSNGTYTRSILASEVYTQSVAVDGAGDVYAGDLNSGNVLLESVATQPTIAFPSTADGTSSAPIATTITNLGNQPLIFSLPGVGMNPQTSRDFALETNSDTTCPVVNAGGTAGQLAANTTCTLSYVFAPTQVGSISGSSVLTDNNLNVALSFQSIALHGVGTQGTQPEQTITFPQPANVIYPGSATLGATASSGLAVSYTLVSGPATLSGNTLTYTGPGTVVVTANQAGNAQIGPAPPVSISIIVTQATAVIDWQPSTLYIYSGTALGANILDATDSIPSTISYSAALLPSGSALPVSAATALTQGSYNLTATFTPQDSLRYGIVSDSLPFTVQNMNVFIASTSSSGASQAVRNGVRAATSSNGYGTVSSLFNNGTPQSAATSGGGIGAAVDASGFVWSINSGGGGLSKFTDAGVFSASYNPAGVAGATALAIDGNSNVIVANGNGTISVVSNAGTSVSTIAGSTAAAPSAVAVDISGNVWVANPAASTVDEIIGGASPAAPLATAVQNTAPGMRP
jgi:hypothetical protein